MKRGIVVFMICLFVICAASVAFAAESRTSGLFTYEIKGNGTAVITDYDWENHGEEDLYIPNMLDGYTITGIGDRAFQRQAGEKGYRYGDEKIMAKLPESIVTIGEKAFFGCNFIKTINIPASVKIIDAGAFARTRIICNVDSQNETFATIDDVLYNKKDRELMFVPNESEVLEDTFKIPNGIESIGEYAFYNVARQGEKSFAVVFPNTIRHIKDYAFSSASLKGEIVFPESLESIGKCAFKSVFASSLDLRNTSLTTIPESAFEQAFVSEILLPKTIKTIGDCAFKEWHSIYSGMRIEIQEGVESIGNNAFASSELTGITLPSTLKSIGDSAFADTYLEKITLPSTLKSIGNNAFANIRLEQITIPDSVDSIGKNIVDRTKVTLVVTPGSYAETWATENGYMIAKQGGDDTSWLNYD